MGRVDEKSAMQKSKHGSKETRLGIEARKEEDFSGWYTQVLLRSEMMDYYDVSGCYILRPWSFAIWKQIQYFLDPHFENLGVQDAYFPLFISQAALNREKDHIEGFAPEVAWVTKAGTSDLQEPIAVRPTSETIFYPAYARWIKSHRDLPLRLNQWCNVVRWEFKHSQPFLRSREFLWQEGHTCFMTKSEADCEVLQVLELYRRVYEEILAVPVVKGRKSESEKFAGALYTTTVEGFVPSVGRGIQGATSHCLGQNFSRMFKICVDANKGAEDSSKLAEAKNEIVANGAQKDEDHEYVWQNSWGLSTRCIGVMVMVHGDNMGLVLPPRVANIQIVIVPVGITARTTPEDQEKIYEKCREVEAVLKTANIRAKADLRDNYTPGWKFNDWEMKGVPARFEIGPKELVEGRTRISIRVSGEKRDLDLCDIEKSAKLLLDEIHETMFTRAKEARENSTRVIEKWDDFTPALDEKCLAIIPWCENKTCEETIKERSSRKAKDDGLIEDGRAPAMGAKSLCIPFDQSPYFITGKCCVQCGAAAKSYALFGRSY